MKKIIILIVLLCPGLVLASTAADQLNARLANITSLTANFSQAVTSEDGAPMQNSKGKLAILRPGKFRWETLKPMHQILITNSAKLWVYEPDLEQVTIRHLSQNVAETPLLLLTEKNIVLQNEFKVMTGPAKGSSQLVQYTLLPLHKNQNFSRVIVSFKGKALSGLQLVNQLGQKTNIRLTHVRLNPSLSNKLFTFIPPKGVDIVDMTKKKTKQ